MRNTLIVFFLGVCLPMIGWASEAYEYANAAEEMYSNDLCDSLYEIACDFYEGKLTEINDWVFEEEFV